MTSKTRKFDKLSATPRISALCLALTLGTIAHADGSPTRMASGIGSVATHGSVTEGTELRVRTELRALMTELIQSGAFGNQPTQDISMDIASPAQRVADLGLLVDSAHPSGDGLVVLAVTPGGSAERMGLRAGDALVEINATPLDGKAAAATLRATVDGLPNGSELSFKVRRDGSTQTLSGAFAGVYLPAMHLTVGDGVQVASADQGAGVAAPAASQGGCGRISAFDVAPRQQNLFGATIIFIDGVTPGPNSTQSFQVAAGSHEVKIAERIPSRYLGFSNQFRDAGLQGANYKTFTVDVAPNTTTLVAARLNKDKANDWHDGVFWDPVAWKVMAETCR